MITANDLIKTLNFSSSDGLVSTQFNQGFMTTKLDPFSLAFTDYAAKQADWCLEVGAAYGVATLEAISKGAKIIANDLHKIHLEVLNLRCPEEYKKNLILSVGKFPNIGLDNNCCPLGAVLACRVLHFMGKNELTESLKKINSLLKKQGKLFLIVDSPYMGWWTDCIPVFEEKKSLQDKWPGIFQPAKDYCNNKEAHAVLPPLVHWFDTETISKELVNNGFLIEKILYINREGIYPQSCCLDGRESVGVIAVKS